MTITNVKHLRLLKRLVNSTGINQDLEMNLVRGEDPEYGVKIRRNNIEEKYVVVPFGSFYLDEAHYLDFESFAPEPDLVEISLGTPPVIFDFLENYLPSWLKSYTIAHSNLKCTEDSEDGQDIVIVNADGILYRSDLITDVEGLRDYCRKNRISLEKIE